jgi:4-methylaminobutanoate oxidase (formaldehyde-forming)
VDGYVDSRKLTQAYLRAAQTGGAKLRTGVTVQGVRVQQGCVTGVHTDCGDVRCALVINAAGAFATRVAEMVGMCLPAIPVRHKLVVSTEMPGVSDLLPVVRIPDRNVYLRPEKHQMMIGGFESQPLSYDPRALPNDFQMPDAPVNWTQLTEFVDAVAPVLPTIDRASFSRVQKGWPTCTPDGEFIIGSSPNVHGFIMVGGCNIEGVSCSAGIAEAVVETVLNGEPTSYSGNVSPTRFNSASWAWEDARRAAEAQYTHHYAIERQSA